MDLHTSFGVLSQIVEQYESHGRSVRQVEATTGGADGDTVHAKMDVPVSLCSATDGGLHPELTPEAASLTDEGRLQIEFSTSVLDPLQSTTEAAVSASTRTVRVADDGDILLTVELTIAPPGDETGAATTADDESEPADPLAAARDESVPPYEDTEYLRRLYDACDTFAEMSRKIEMDVTSETVRRYMIEAGVHTPTSYNMSTESKQADGRSAPTTEGGETKTETKRETEEEAETDRSTSGQPPAAADAGTETPPPELLVTDGIGLPEHLQIEEIVDAVLESATVYEVQRHLDLEWERTRELLQQLDLLDLVMHRLSADAERNTSRGEIVSRIRQCAPAGGRPRAHT
jgi:hypothetical protein